MSYSELKKRYKDAEPHELPDKLAILKLERKKKERRLEREKKMKEKRLQSEQELDAAIEGRGGGWMEWMKAKVKKNWSFEILFTI